MNELLKTALANHIIAYYRVSAYHWNVTGIEFPQYHEFFGDLYEQYQDQVDTLAEYIRIQGEAVPYSIKDIYEFATLAEEERTGLTLRAMLIGAKQTNDELIKTMTGLFDIAEAAQKQGIADYAAGMLDKYKKNDWMIRSCLTEG